MADLHFESSLQDKMQALIHRAVWNEALGKVAHPILPLSEGIEERPPFYCVHALSGAGSILGELARLLGPEQPFFGIQAPTQKRTAAFAASIEGIAKYYVDALMEFQPTGRFALGGWSVGSIIALEMAQQLRRRRGRDDIMLVNIDCELLNVTAGLSRSNPLYFAKVLANFPAWLSYEVGGEHWSLGSFGVRVRNKITAWARMARSRIVEGRLVHGHAVDGFMDTSHFTPDHRAFVATLYDALYRYIPAPYPGAVVVYEASVQPFAHLRQVAATWRTIARPEVIPVTGTHASIIKAPDGRALAQHLRARLAMFAVAASPPREAGVTQSDQREWACSE
jgi:thioesterase domain-containing protein